MSNDNLAIYLNDHLAGSVSAIELIDHLAGHAPELAAFLRKLKTDIEADQKELERLIAQSGKEQSTLRKAAGWLAEKGAQIKLAVDGPAGSAFAKMQSLEALCLGITGKRELWRALQTSLGPVQGFDWDSLISRAEEQYQATEDRRLEAARAALR